MTNDQPKAPMSAEQIKKELINLVNSKLGKDDVTFNANVVYSYVCKMESLLKQTCADKQAEIDRLNIYVSLERANAVHWRNYYDEAVLNGKHLEYNELKANADKMHEALNKLRDKSIDLMNFCIDRGYLDGEELTEGQTEFNESITSADNEIKHYKSKYESIDNVNRAIK